MPTAKAVAGTTLLSPTDHTLILVDFQAQMAFATKSIDGIALRNNAALVANAGLVGARPELRGLRHCHACGDVSEEAHERAMARMVQAGVRPMTALQYLLELQRDWARNETYAMTTSVAAVFGGAYGLGLIYAKTMLGPPGSEAPGLTTNLGIFRTMRRAAFPYQSPLTPFYARSYQ